VNHTPPNDPTEPEESEGVLRPQDVPTEPLILGESPTQVVEGVFGAGSYREIVEDQTVAPQPTRRTRRSLTDTEAGQSIFIGLWILGTLATVAALVGAFLAGQHIANLGAVEPEVVPEVVEETITFPDLTGGPVGPGVWSYDELRGGECISGYAGAFAESYSVVSCASPHDAQLVFAQLLSDNPAEAYPGEEVVAAQAPDICDAGLSLNREIAAEYADLVMESSYPVDTTQWESGSRVVYCFISRGSGATLMGSLIN